MELLPSGSQIIVCNDHKTLAGFMNGNNANNKVKRWELELSTYNITFEWISGACNKAADCLSHLVELPQDRPSTINMLSATNFEGPTFNTRSRTAQHSSSGNTTPQTDAIAPDVTDTQSTTPQSLTADRLEALLQIQKMDPFCKCTLKQLSNRKALKQEADLFLHVKGLLYKHITDSHQKFLAIVIPKAWKHTVLVEAHDKSWSPGSYTDLLLNKTSVLLERYKQ